MSSTRGSCPRCADVVVVGGGPAGSAAAIGLARRGASVVVLERTRYEEQRVGETLAPETGWWLRALRGGQPGPTCDHLSSPGIRSVWGDSEPRERCFVFDPHGSGWHVDRRRFDADLSRSAGCAGAVVLEGAALAACERQGGSWRLSGRCLQGRFDLSCGFVVDASGRRAVVARTQGARRVCADPLVAVVRYLSDEFREPEACALIEAVEQGWWYTAPLPGNRIVAAFLTDADLVGGHPAKAWDASLAGAPFTASRLAGRGAVAEARCVAAGGSWLDRVWGAGWLAAGDAAAAHDPLSGHGVLRALRGGLRAAQAVAHAAEGQRATLDAYAHDAASDVASYLEERERIYGSEHRFRDAPFWARRRHPPKELLDRVGVADKRDHLAIG
jgi:flavin-dependent dehydrogenase